MAEEHPPAWQIEGKQEAEDWKAALHSAVEHMKVDRVNVAAGAFAYRWFLSLFPIVIALLGLATLVTLPRHVVVSLIHGVTRALPAGAAQVFTQAITQADRAAVVTCWPP